MGQKYFNNETINALPSPLFSREFETINAKKSLTDFRWGGRLWSQTRAKKMEMGEHLWSHY
jgi:hypothetical protein